MALNDEASRGSAKLNERTPVFIFKSKYWSGVLVVSGTTCIAESAELAEIALFEFPAMSEKAIISTARKVFDPSVAKCDEARLSMSISGPVKVSTNVGILVGITSADEVMVWMKVELALLTEFWSESIPALSVLYRTVSEKLSVSVALFMLRIKDVKLGLVVSAIKLLACRTAV